jgi:hypothetical protein
VGTLRRLLAHASPGLLTAGVAFEVLSALSCDDEMHAFGDERTGRSHDCASKHRHP